MIGLPADWSVNIVIWAVLTAAIAVWQVVTARNPDLPAFGDVLAWARRFWLVRWGIIGFWGWLGWHLFFQTTLEL